MLNMMRTYLATYLKNEEGQGMVEYGLLVALISVAAIAAILLFGPDLVAIFTKAGTALDTGATAP